MALVCPPIPIRNSNIAMASLGIVIIGRNEGERLRRCLESVLGTEVKIVYVDSGSVDRSVDLASELGVDVVLLDQSRPFSAARARNEGFHRLVQLYPDVDRIQFVDGDCEVMSGWFVVGNKVLDTHPGAGVVCGRTRERYPDRTIYNRLCDIEWNVPPGEVAACGGIMMVRVDVFKSVEGFDPGVIAAEDDEFCLRVRRRGWKVIRVADDMVLHDAAMTRVSQWWNRAVRCGYAYSLGVSLHGRGPERYFVRERRRAIVWGAVIPLLAVVPAIPFGGWSLLLFALYPLQLAHTYRGLRRRALRPRDAFAFAMSCVLAKFPQAVGVWRHRRDRLRRRAAEIIEHQ